MFNALKQLDRNLWIRFVGETNTGIMMFMIAPFVVLYYADRLDSYFFFGFILASGPIISLFGGVLCGHFADHFRRRLLLLLSLTG
ncbi:MAG TPA: MFS transporter, partial [Exiguobacterium sp.]|nr:MFS transporter [Exiguobacterium sp.]